MSRTLLVMGASSDIGMALIRESLSDYDTIIAHYRTMSEKLSALAQQCGEKLVLVQADLSQDGDVESMIADIKGRGLAPSDIVLLPAPQFDHLRFHKIPYAVFQNGLDICFRSAVLITQAFLPAMTKKKEGHVVFILSSTICAPVAKHCAQYVTVKFALLGLMQALAAEYSEKNIAVNALSPTVVKTRFIDNQPRFMLESQLAESGKTQMLTPEEVAEKIGELLNVEPSQMSGQNILLA